MENSGTPADKVVEQGDRLDFLGSGLQEKFTVNLGGLISRDIGMVGRSTAVLEATSDRWAGTELVVKTSWPGSGRGREMDFVKKATDEAEKTAGQWAAKHLPRVFYAKDVVFDKSSCSGVCRASVRGWQGHQQERVIIQERLYALESLTNVRDIGRVFFDVACSTWPFAPKLRSAYPTSVHRWLYEYPSILHCDLSPNNIMIEETNGEGERERKVHGVLTDYDLSSWKEDLENDCTGSSQQRMGTPMYMAEESLSGTSSTYLYRHDVESLFYIICGRCTFNVVNGGAGKDAKRRVVVREGKLPYQKWFDIQYSWSTLGSLKNCFFMHLDDIELSPPFEDFRPWLTHGTSSRTFRRVHVRTSPPEQLSAVATGTETGRRVQWHVELNPHPCHPPFDNDTLNGYVDHSSLIEPTRDASPPLPTSDNSSRVQTNL